MKFLDPNHPMFRSPVVRWLTVLVPLGWGTFEFVWIGQPFWGVLFVSAGLYAGWMLFFQRKG